VNRLRRQSRRRHGPLRRLARIGPEIVAAASDNDPTNVGTAAAVGASTAYQLSWVAILVGPVLAVVQAIAAQFGVVARADLQTMTLKRYGPRVAGVLLVSVVVVNVVTISADLQAGAAGIGLLAGVDPRWPVLPLGLALAGLLLIGKYDEVVAVLRYLLLGFLAFVGAAMLAHPDWPSLLEGSLVPALPLRPSILAGALALLGTTLTSYVYVWETIERGVEDPPDDSPLGSRLARAKAGTVAGGVLTAVILWSMLVTSAATLGRRHQTAATAQQTAQELRPLAGSLATDLFAIGLITSAVVALPVLIATTAYIVGAQFDWRRGLSEGISHARCFYAVLGASIGLAAAVALAGVSVVGMLVAASLIAGFATPIGLVVLVRLARDPEVMGEHQISARLAAAGWAVTVIVGGLGLLLAVCAAAGRC
jgi:Mn2+/Fe2+ NRAMP family transporter